jgi:hypothetical protein
MRVGKYPDEIINKHIIYMCDKGITRVLFDKGAWPKIENKKIKKAYRRHYYYKALIQKHMNRHLIPDLVNMVYAYV